MIDLKFLRYAIVGLGLNATLYLIYLLLTWRMLPSEAAMTVVFVLGILMSFVAHRNITFAHKGRRRDALRRFAICYGAMYALNLWALWFFVEHMNIPHQIVQGCAILIIALLGFVVQKYWVFPEHVGGRAGVEAQVTP